MPAIACPGQPHAGRGARTSTLRISSTPDREPQIAPLYSVPMARELPHPSVDIPVQPQNALVRLFYRPPFIGIVAFLAVLLAIPLAHMAMMLNLNLFGEAHRYQSAFALGWVGIALLALGAKIRREAPATWLGFFGGMLTWTTWVEFSLIWFGRDVFPLPAQVAGERVIQYPEHMILMASFGLLMTAFFFFFHNKDTRCHFFEWFHRNLRLDLGKRGSARERNIAVITFTETVYITWFFYVCQLIVLSPNLVGIDHWFAYVAFAGCLVWGLYCFIRLMRYRRISSAVRYAIPTTIILWVDVRFLAGWGVITEFYARPEKYILECLIVVGACLVATVLTMKAPRKSSEIEAS